MKKIIFLLIISSILIISCGSHFNPRYYYNRGSSSSGNTDSPDIGGGGEGLSPEDDPFVDYDGSRPWNDPDYGFKMNFDEYVIEAKFDENNRPTYKLVPGKWNQSDTSKNEYWYDGPDTEGGGTTIGSMKYYLYKGNNHLFAADSAYNKSDRLDRFYFYRFEGAAFGVSIKNCLIAIDTYSKLVFAFGVPSLWKRPVNIIGVPYAPASWQAVENGWEAKYEVNTQDRFANVNGIQYFYEYDPVGVVKANGEIEIFQWCLDSIGDNSKYAPRVKGNAIDLGRPIDSETEKEGRSPYMPIKVDAKLSMAVTAEQIQIQNVDVVSANYFFGGIDYKKGLAGISYDIRFGYNTSSGVMDNFVTINKFDKTTMFADLFSVKVGETKTITSTPSELKIEYTEKEDIYLLLDANVTVYSSGNFWTSEWASAMIDLETPIVKLKYDKTKDAFVFDSIYGNNADRIIEHTEGFELIKGSSKDFTITFKSTEIGEEKKTGTMKLIYKLKY